MKLSCFTLHSALCFFGKAVRDNEIACELKFMLTTEQQKEKLEEIDNCRLSIIALSECDAYLEGFKLGMRMTTEVFADTLP